MSDATVPARKRQPSGRRPASDRVRLHRLPERGHYDRATIDAIVDAAVVGHVGYVVDGQPFVTPTAVWRHGDRLYWHGSTASRMLRATKDGVPVCITMTHLDGLVLARSGFDHSLNYRSVMVLGRAREVEGDEQRLAALRDFVEHLFPVLWIDLAEASAKIRVGPPKDPEADRSWPVWAGVVPVRSATGTPEPDAHLPAGIPLPAYLCRQGDALTGAARKASRPHPQRGGAP